MEPERVVSVHTGVLVHGRGITYKDRGQGDGER